jgi:hypothetical protein
MSPSPKLDRTSDSVAGSKFYVLGFRLGICASKTWAAIALSQVREKPSRSLKLKTCNLKPKTYNLLLPDVLRVEAGELGDTPDLQRVIKLVSIVVDQRFALQ